jgi:5'-deoxynucleotidase
MPTPIKYHGTVLTSAYKNVEKLAAKKLLSSLPDELKASYEPLLKGADDYTARVVKAADKLSAYIKCVEELKAGNAEFSLAAKQTREKLDAMDMPEVRYFLENFIQAFEMTLDELNFSVD